MQQHHDATRNEAEQTTAAWNAVADGYDEYVTPMNSVLAEEALELAGLRSGERVLDVASGSGAIALAAARRGARVLATDIAPGMISRLTQRADAEKLTELDARVMDGHALALEDDAFDVAASQFGVMLFPDLPRGVREMVRVTKPGGRVVLVAFGNPQEAEFLTVFMGAIRTVVPDFAGLPLDPPPLPFQVADPDTLRRRLEEAGLQDVRVHRTTHVTPYESGDHMWRTVLSSNPIAGGLVASLTEDQQREVRKVLDATLRERSGGDGPAELTSPVNVGIGRK